jgi:hypothetical protein
VHLVWKLLQADRGALGLLAGDPFGGRKPRFVRATLYRYHPNPPRAKVWWERSVLRPWLPPLSAEDPDLRAFLQARGWID